jgi:ribonuclease R
MLPEALSNGWCSLRPDEERGCLAAFITIDCDGEIRGHRFQRGLMRSHARLTYEQVQDARDGHPDAATGPLVENVITPLYGAFVALLKARERRGTLELDITERKVMISESGHVEGIEPRKRLDSHRLIEEFMITANVAAAETLEKTKLPCMYRVHDAPDPEKVESLRNVLESLDLTLPRGNVKPVNFTRVLERVEDTPAAPLVNDLVLRCQSQAVYSPENLGHFGLALDRYAHFTSPIRRYADLLVHRALIRGLGLGSDGLPEDQAEKFDEIGQHISQTERRAAAAERDAVDRFTAAYLKDRIGAHFDGRINGVTRFGLFVTLDDTGADGLVPISTLPDDYYDHVEAEHCLVGRRWGRIYRLGDRVRVRLAEADMATGGIVFDLEEVVHSPAEQLGAEKPAPTPRGPGTGKRRAAARKKAGKAAKPMQSRKGHRKASGASSRRNGGRGR